MDLRRFLVLYAPAIFSKPMHLLGLSLGSGRWTNELSGLVIKS